MGKQMIAVSVGPRDAQKKEIRIRAKFFVVALGGIETPRIFLNSVSFTYNRIGPSYNNIGRFFADHYDVTAGTLVLNKNIDVFSPVFVDQKIDRPGNKLIK